MKRVLKPGGRLVFTVWSQVHRHHAALADALSQHISEEAGASCLAPFAWRDADTIRKLVDDVSFQAVEMEAIESTTRILASADAVRSFIAYMASRSPFGNEIEDTLAALTQDVFSALQVYREGNEFVMPSQAHLVQARTASA